MNLRQHRWVTIMLLLAMVVLPWRALYAQSEMLPASGAEHEYISQGFSQSDEQHAKECCQQKQSQCNQSCDDCFHCGTLHAVISVPVLATGRSGLDYALPARNTHISIIPSGQFRPPRLII